MSKIGWVELNLDGWTGVDKFMQGWKGGQVAIGVDGWLFRQGWMGGYRGGRVDGWLQGWMGGCRGGQVAEWVEGWLISTIVPLSSSLSSEHLQDQA